LLSVRIMTPTHTTWEIDPAHSELRFTVSHLVIGRISGRYGHWRTTVRLDEADVRRSSVEVAIDAASLDTGNPARDADLRSRQFLDVEHYPQIRFRSIEIVPAGGSDYLINGELMIRGVARPVTLFVSDKGRVRDPGGRMRAAFSAHGEFDRREFGMRSESKLEAGGFIVGDRVEVHVEAEAVEVTRSPTGLALAGTEKP
jgi:polyisoprenoid-binding protein YceI